MLGKYNYLLCITITLTSTVYILRCIRCYMVHRVAVVNVHHDTEIWKAFS